MGVLGEQNCFNCGLNWMCVCNILKGIELYLRKPKEYSPETEKKLITFSIINIIKKYIAIIYKYVLVINELVC